MMRQQLCELVDAGLSTRQIATRLGRSPTTVRYWLSRHGLVTRQSAQRRMATARATDSFELVAVCPRHGSTSHRKRSDSGIACLRCRSEAVARRRRRVKRILVDEAGGRCVLCGYSRSYAALVFHHVEPSRKSFGLAHRGSSRSLARAREEARKCLLLCANCHAEVEAGVVVPPPSLVQVGPG